MSTSHSTSGASAVKFLLTRSSWTAGPAFLPEPCFRAIADVIPCRLQSRCTRFSLAVKPFSRISSSAMSRYPNSGSSACTSYAALIRCASSQSRRLTGSARHA